MVEALCELCMHGSHTPWAWPSTLLIGAAGASFGFRVLLFGSSNVVALGVRPHICCPNERKSHHEKIYIWMLILVLKTNECNVCYLGKLWTCNRLLELGKAFLRKSRCPRHARSIEIGALNLEQWQTDGCCCYYKIYNIGSPITTHQIDQPSGDEIEV